MKKTQQKNKQQKKLVWIAGIIAIINILLVAAFLIYLYFWIKGRS